MLTIHLWHHPNPSVGKPDWVHVGHLNMWIKRCISHNDWADDPTFVQVTIWALRPWSFSSIVQGSDQNIPSPRTISILFSTLSQSNVSFAFFLFDPSVHSSLVPTSNTLEILSAHNSPLLRLSFFFSPQGPAIHMHLFLFSELCSHTIPLTSDILEGKYHHHPSFFSEKDTETEKLRNLPSSQVNRTGI